MHERSLVRALLTQIERLVAKQGAGQVEEIRVQLGPLSNVDPILVESAFQALAPESAAAGARLVVEEVPLTGRCAVCRSEFEIVRFQFQCPQCRSQDIDVTAGDGFVLESITVRRETTAADCL